MKIKTLNLLSFGKFQNKTIQLDEGFNLILGPNEAGKSTIQHFIEGMFFGFYKPYRKKRAYDDNFARYKPRHSDKYYGSMIIEDDLGREIRIERDFLKTRDSVRIFDEVTGEEISQTYPYDNVTKQYMPLGYGGVNSVVYNNTVNFKQMSSKSDENLAKEVNNRLVDAASENSSDVSISGVLDYLKEKKEAIGTFGKTKSNYGMAVRQRDNLEGILKESEDTYRHVRYNQKKILDLENEITDLESVNEKRNFENRARKQRQIEKQRASIAETKKRIEKIKHENIDLKKQLDDLLSRYGSYDQEVYNRMRLLSDGLEANEKRVESLGKKMDELKREKAETDRRCAHLERNLQGLTKEQLEGDYNAYLSLSGRRPKKSKVLEKAKQNYTKTASKEKENQTKGKIRNQTINPWICAAAAVIGFIFAIFSFINPVQMGFGFQLVLSFIGLLLGFYSIAFLIIQGKFITNPSSEPEISSESLDYSFSSRWTSKEQIIEAYGQTKDEEYIALVKRLKTFFDRYDKLSRKSEHQHIHFESIKQERQTLSGELQKQKLELAELLSSVGVEKIDDYGEAASHLGEIEKLRAQISANKRLYNELSNKEYVPVDTRISDSEDDSLIVTNENNAKRDEAKLESLKLEVSRLEGENTSMMNGVGNPVAIKEQIERLNRQIESYETELRACDMAETFFVNYKRETHRGKAVDLNKRIGKILYTITGKYREVKVDEDLQIKILNPDDGELIGIDQLSGGTIDQIYFALRFGVRDIVDGNRSLPFILDDPFVQYDEQRKIAALKFLHQVSRKNQVILFSCSDDEKNILDKQMMDYTGIPLVM